MAQETTNSRHAIVIFDSRFGNTEKIARSLETGLKQAGLETVCVNSKQVSQESLKEYDLIAVGAPTEKFTASEPIKEFFGKLKKRSTPYLVGKTGFAFDTKLPHRLSGSAAKSIEKELKGLGLSIIAPHESAFVFYPKGGKDRDVKIKEGEEKRFEDVGRQIGAMFLATESAMPA